MKKISIIIIILLFSTNIVNSQKNITLRSNGYSTVLAESGSVSYVEWNGVKPVIRIGDSFNTSNLNKLLISQKGGFGLIKDVSSEYESIAEELGSYTVRLRTAFYTTEDGTFQAPTTSIFFKPTNQTDVESRFSNFGTVQAHEFLNGYYNLQVNNSYNTGDKVIDLCNSLFDNGLTIVAEPVFIRLLKPNSDPNVALWQWNINNTRQRGGTAGADTKTLGVWNSGFAGNGIKVAVLDEGVQLNHPDLRNNLLTGYDATGLGNGGNANAGDSHGTNCAGIIAAEENGFGVQGLAYKSKIIPIRVAYNALVNNVWRWVSNDDWLSDGINQAVSKGADILSNSWGGGGGSAKIDAAIQNAITNGRNGKGSVVLFATGNDNREVAYPATNPNVIAVGASAQCDTRKRSTNNPALLIGRPRTLTDPLGVSCDGEELWGSNFGANLDVLAPGVNITTTTLRGTGNLQNDYDNLFNGTSAACPNAAGVIALILSANPNLTGQQAKDILETTCDKIGGYTYNQNVGGQPNGTWSTDAAMVG